MLLCILFPLLHADYVTLGRNYLHVVPQEKKKYSIVYSEASQRKRAGIVIQPTLIQVVDLSQACRDRNVCLDS